jgi:hypothetical protein
LQGSVEVQRAGSKSWTQVKRLDTSLCAGDRLRTGTSSRAALFLQPETLVRVDQNTTITLNQLNEGDRSRVFACRTCGGSDERQVLWGGLLHHALPKEIQGQTPHMNAAVEGTEFMVGLSSDRRN